MDIEVRNNVPNIKVVTRQNSDDSITIYVSENNGERELGSFNPGDTVKIGNREYIVLGHEEKTTTVITEEPTRMAMEFGGFGDYEQSGVREYCNGKFYKELCKAVGENNIIPHTVNLEADDGTGKGKTCKDNVSILTTENYRRYREFLKPCYNWWWTATRLSCDNPNYNYLVGYVDGSGILSWIEYDFFHIGVRPFCILNSSINVTTVEEIGESNVE